VNVETARRRFEAYLRERGLRVTRPRMEILELAWSTHRHFSAEELWGWVRERSSTTSRATVYRTLALLVEGGFLAPLDDRSGQMLYEHILGHSHHDHMICLGCGRILEFRNEAIEELQEEVAREHGFHLTGHTLTLEGYCRSCARRRPGLLEGGREEAAGGS